MAVVALQPTTMEKNRSRDRGEYQPARTHQGLEPHTCIGSPGEKTEYWRIEEETGPPGVALWSSQRSDIQNHGGGRCQTHASSTTLKN